MNACGSSRFWILLLLGAAAALPTGVQAQQPSTPAVTPLVATPQADLLHQRALALADGSVTAREIRSMARLHVRSAEMRPANDPRAEDCYRAAAQLLSGTAPARAMQLFERAGDRALLRGAHFIAANAYLDGVEVARASSTGNAQVARQAQVLTQKAEQIANGSSLPAAERDWLRQRFTPDTR